MLAVSKIFMWLPVVAEEGLSLLWTGAGATVKLDEMMESNGFFVLCVLFFEIRGSQLINGPG